MTCSAYFDCDETLYQKSYRIPNPPIISLESVKYYDLSDNLQTIPSNEYVLNSDMNDSALLFFNDEFGKKTLSRERMAPVQITFKAGYTSAIIPKPLKQAILLLISHYYDIREPILTTGTIQKVPRSVDFIFNQYKIRSV